MRITKRAQTMVLSAVLALTCVAPAVSARTASPRTVNAEETAYTDLNNYYGKRLTDPTSKAFYSILEDMDFASGESVKIEDSAILSEAAAYTVGDPSVLKKLGAAVDSFKYDHTEYFYVDFDLLTLNIKTKGNDLIVELGAGRSDSYFVKGFTKENIPAAVTEYNTALDAFVGGITLAENATAEDKAKAVTKAIAEKVDYSFCVDVSTGEDTLGAPYIRTAYGALKYEKVVCEGYSRIFKATMDKLGVVNVLVNGWLSDGDNIDLHMWNLVEQNGSWFGSDPTVADGDVYNAALAWQTGETLEEDHTVVNTISTSGYEMPFPSAHKAGDVIDPWIEGTSGLKLKLLSDTKISISYDGVNHETLTQTKGWYMTMRYSFTGTGSETFSEWMTIQYVKDFFEGNMGVNVLELTDNTTILNVEFSNTASIKAIQFAVCDAAGDKDSLSASKVVYSDAYFNAHVIEKTGNAYDNPDNDPTYKIPPFATVSPSNLIDMDVQANQTAHNLSVRYNLPLQLKAGETQPKISFTAAYTESGAPVANIHENASVSDIKLSEDKTTLSFVFRPSISFSDNELTYTFTVDNMDCAYDDGTTVAPCTFTLSTRRTYIVCNRVYGDGRLYINAFATPSLVENTDLSMKGWTYDNGKKVSESQRSQLALIVKRPANATELEGAVKDQLGQPEELKCSTYELDLSICNRITEIPAGSYLKLNFGFPAGITADMEGVEFEVFHFKKVNGQLDYDHPERLNCVVTKYGLTVTVDSFSPFVVVARPSTAEDAARKGIVTAVNGLGGSVTADTNKPVNFLEKAEDSVTYTLTPADDSYTVEYVTLGGKELTVTDGKVTVRYADLEERNNVLNVGFAKKSVLAAEEAAGEVNAVKSYAMKTYDKTYATAPQFGNIGTGNGGVENNGLSGGMIALIVILVVVVFAAVGVLVWFVARKKAKAYDAEETDKKPRNKK